MTPNLRAATKQTSPFLSAEQEVFLHLVRTAAELEHGLAEGLRSFGLTPTQYNALRILRGAGDGGLCRNEICGRMLRRVPDATRLLDRLEDSGLVERERVGEDRRFVISRITKKGLALLAEIDAPLAHMHTAQLGHLTPVDLRQLAQLLTKARSKP